MTQYSIISEQYNKIIDVAIIITATVVTLFLWISGSFHMFATVPLESSALGTNGGSRRVGTTS